MTKYLNEHVVFQGSRGNIHLTAKSALVGFGPYLKVLSLNALSLLLMGGHLHTSCTPPQRARQEVSGQEPPLPNEYKYRLDSLQTLWYKYDSEGDTVQLLQRIECFIYDDSLQIRHRLAYDAHRDFRLQTTYAENIDSVIIYEDSRYPLWTGSSGWIEMIKPTQEDTCQTTWVRNGPHWTQKDGTTCRRTSTNGDTITHITEKSLHRFSKSVLDGRTVRIQHENRENVQSDWHISRLQTFLYVAGRIQEMKEYLLVNDRLTLAHHMRCTEAKTGARLCEYYNADYDSDYNMVLSGREAEKQPTPFDPIVIEYFDDDDNDGKLEPDRIEITEKSTTGQLLKLTTYNISNNGYPHVVKSYQYDETNRNVSEIIEWKEVREGPTVKEQVTTITYHELSQNTPATIHVRYKNIQAQTDKQYFHLESKFDSHGNIVEFITRLQHDAKPSRVTLHYDYTKLASEVFYPKQIFKEAQGPKGSYPIIHPIIGRKSYYSLNDVWILSTEQLHHYSGL